MKKIIIIIIFSSLIFIPLCTFNFQQNRVSDNEQRILANMPKIFDGKGSIIIERDSVQSWVEDNIGFRETFVNLAANIQYRLFHKPPSHQVQIGKSDWLFYAIDNNLEIAYETYPLSNETLIKIAENQKLIYTNLQAIGKEYVIVLPPSKVSIYPEKLYGNFEIRDTPVDILADYLEEHTPITLIRLKESLLYEKLNEQVYFKTDTHWNDAGIYIAYKKIIEDLSRLDILDSKLVDVHWKTERYFGDLVKMLKLPHSKSTEEQKAMTIINPIAQKIEHSNEHNTNKEISFKNPSKEKELLIYGDSMFAGSMTQLLAEHFSQTSFIRDYRIDFSDIKNTNADIILFELTERAISLLEY